MFVESIGMAESENSGCQLRRGDLMRNFYCRLVRTLIGVSILVVAAGDAARMEFL
jgi:hypothetical protein